MNRIRRSIVKSVTLLLISTHFIKIDLFKKKMETLEQSYVKKKSDKFTWYLDIND